MSQKTFETQPEEIFFRKIEYTGYRLEGVLWQVKARLKDVRTSDFPCIDRGGFIRAGEAFHEMSLSLIFNDDLVIQDIQVRIENAPFSICPCTEKFFSSLVGAKIEKGFYRQARLLLPIKKTCVHLFDLLMGAATVAFQTVEPMRYFKYMRGTKPETIDGCYAWDASGPVVKREWPQYAVDAKGKNNGQT